MKSNLIYKSFAVVLIVVQGSLAMCSGSDDLGTYKAIKGDSDAVNALGKTIAQTQRAEVFPGHNEFDCYTKAMEDSFHAHHKLKGLISKLTHNKVFNPGIHALLKLDAKKRDEALDHFSETNFATWAENGHIGDDGTTDAGAEVEAEISAACVKAVKAALATNNADGGGK